MPKFQTLVELLQFRSEQQSSQTAFTFLSAGEDCTASFSYHELDRQARAIAYVLQSRDLVGKRALLLYPSGLEFVAAFFGCLYAGVVAVPVYPPRRNQKNNRLQSIIIDSKAAVALTVSSLLSDVEHQFSQSPHFMDIDCLSTDNIPPEKSQGWQDLKIASHELAFLQYTSGSTGLPKGVMLSHGNLLHNLTLICQHFEHSPNSQGVIWLPHHHDMGLIGGILQPLYSGFSVALMPPEIFIKSPIRWLKSISRYRATTSGGPNFAYDMCVKRIKPEQLEGLDLSCWEIAFIGAEPVRAETIERFNKTFQPYGFRREAFYPCYGMAETTLIISGGIKKSEPILKKIKEEALANNRVEICSSTSEEQGIRTIVGCGQSWLNQKIEIVNPESLTRCQPNQIGEIWVSSPSVCKGYWNRAEETEKVFRGYLAETQEGPFLRTGDLGFLLDNELFVTGRLKDIIIIRGQNHYPQDIELTVEKSHIALQPSLGAAFVIGVEGSPKLVVAHEVKRSCLRKLNAKEVIGNIRKSVGAEHGLQVYAVVLIKTGKIPRTSSGKIQRHACKVGFLEGTLKTIEDWSENPQCTAKFLALKSEVESLSRKLEV